MELLRSNPTEVKQIEKSGITITSAPHPGGSFSYDRYKYVFHNGRVIFGFSDGAGHGLSVLSASERALADSFQFLTQYCSEPESVEKARQQLELSIKQAARSVWKNERAACTLSIVTFFEGYTIVGWVGDSRVLELNNNYLSVVSIPDSLNTHPYWDTIQMDSPDRLYAAKQQTQMAVDSITTRKDLRQASDVEQMFYSQRKQPGQLLGSKDGSHITVSSIDRVMTSGHEIIVCSDDVCTSVPLQTLKCQLKLKNDKEIVRAVARGANNDATIIRIPIK